jgi:hypothetical protein
MVHDGQTTIDRLLDEDSRETEGKSILEAMLSMPATVNQQMVETRRKELFSVIWEELSLFWSVFPRSLKRNSRIRTKGVRSVL